MFSTKEKYFKLILYIAVVVLINVLSIPETPVKFGFQSESANDDMSGCE